MIPRFSGIEYPKRRYSLSHLVSRFSCVKQYRAIRKNFRADCLAACRCLAVSTSAKRRVIPEIALLRTRNAYNRARRFAAYADTRATLPAIRIVVRRRRVAKWWVESYNSGRCDVRRESVEQFRGIRKDSRFGNFWQLLGSLDPMEYKYPFSVPAEISCHSARRYADILYWKWVELARGKYRR